MASKKTSFFGLKTFLKPLKVQILRFYVFNFCQTLYRPMRPYLISYFNRDLLVLCNLQKTIDRENGVGPIGCSSFVDKTFKN